MIPCEWSDEDSNAAVCIAHAESFAMGFDTCPQTFADLQAFVKANNKEVNLCELECSMIEDQNSCDATDGCSFIDTGDINAADKSLECLPKPEIPPVNTGCADALALANAATAAADALAAAAAGGGGDTTADPTLGRALYVGSNASSSLVGPSVALAGFVALAFVAHRRLRRASTEGESLRRGSRRAYGAV